MSSWLSLSKEDTSSGRWRAALGQRRGAFLGVATARVCHFFVNFRSHYCRSPITFIRPSTVVAVPKSRSGAARARVVFSAICWIVLEQRQSRQR